MPAAAAAVADQSPPHRCRKCQRRGRVVYTRARKRYRVRRYVCDACNWRWNTYEWRVHPKKVKPRRRD